MYVSWMPESDHKRAYNFWMKCTSLNLAQWWLCSFTHLTRLFSHFSKGVVKAAPDCGLVHLDRVPLPGITTYTESPPFEARIELHQQGLGNLGDNVTGAGGALLVLTDSVMSPMGMVYSPPPLPCKHKVTSLHFKCLWNKSVVVHIVIYSAAMCVGLCIDLLGFWDESLVSPSPCPLDRQNHET